MLFNVMGGNAIRKNENHHFQYMTALRYVNVISVMQGVRKDPTRTGSSQQSH